MMQFRTALAAVRVVQGGTAVVPTATTATVNVEPPRRRTRRQRYLVVRDVDENGLWSITSCRSDLDLQAASSEERIDGAQVIVELESIGDHRLGIDDTLREQSKGAFEAVKDGH